MAKQYPTAEELSKLSYEAQEKCFIKELDHLYSSLKNSTEKGYNQYTLLPDCVPYNYLFQKYYRDRVTTSLTNHGYKVTWSWFSGALVINWNLG